MVLLSVALVASCCIALMFKSTWIFLAHAFMWTVVALKWIIIGGLVFSFLNCPQVYRALGWTPLSLLVGDKLYRK